jgi:hypothetical protein
MENNIEIMSRCPHTACGKGNTHTFGIAQAKSMFENNNLTLWCFTCGHEWQASQTEKADIAKELESLTN